MADKLEVTGYNKEITDIGGGMFMDSSPLMQPKGSYRFALNAVDETNEGDRGSLSNEGAAYNCSSFPTGYLPIGDRYIEDNTTFVILVNPSTGFNDIGIIDKNDQYNSIVNTSILGIKITNQCDIVYRLRRGNERVFYWTDGENQIRTFNIDKPHDFYSAAYKSYLKGGGDPNTFIGERWDLNSFSLIKSYSIIPNFNSVEIIEGGNITPGSYNFAIQYVDDDLNPTEWITTSNTVNIFNDSLSKIYHNIRGSKNVKTDSQSFEPANKSIKLLLSNLDTSFPYYRIAVIQGTSINATVTKVLVSEIKSCFDPVFVYSGSEENYIQGSLTDILVDKEIIYSPKHIEQIENRLVVANGKGKNLPWCDFQKFASKIGSKLVTRQYVLDSVRDSANPKNGNSSFLFKGNMPGEVYSYGIVYISKDGYISPAFHIPGLDSDDLEINKLRAYKTSSTYLDIHDCTTGDYWGVDINGKPLLGDKVRLHRYPFRSDIDLDLVDFEYINETRNLEYYIYFDRQGLPTDPLPTGYLRGYLRYTFVDDPDNPIIIPYDMQRDGVSISVYQGNREIINTSGGIPRYIDFINVNSDADALDYYNYINSYKLTRSEGETTQRPVSNLMGINFYNIEKPHPDIVGFYIVRNERTEDDRLIIDNGIFGPCMKNNKTDESLVYNSFGNLVPHLDPTVTSDMNKVSKNVVWFFNPEFQYYGKKREFTSLVREASYEYTGSTVPTASPDGTEGKYTGTAGDLYGILVQDVQAGTSYNPELNKKKDKDDDGFDLLVGWRADLSYYRNSVQTKSLPQLTNKRSLFYLNAAASSVEGSNILYNMSSDNKIGMMTLQSDFPIGTFYQSVDGVKQRRALYCSMVRDKVDAYANFMNRPYYKEHNNPVLFDTGSSQTKKISIFNGDTQIGKFDFISSVFYDMVLADRRKKNNVWKIIVGSVLVVAGAILSIVGVGVGLVAAGVLVLAAAAISYGVSLAMSGIKFEQFKKMIEEDYEKGLRENIEDNALIRCINKASKMEDDTIRWFISRMPAIYIESSVPTALRVGLTAGVPDFLDPTRRDDMYIIDDAEAFKTYIIEKLTILDRNQGSGRLYKGYATAEVYDANPDYMRANKEKIFTHLPLEYDCCSQNSENFPTRVWYSQQSFQEEKTDNYASFLPNNYRDIEGEHGEVTDLYKLGTNLFVRTKEALYQLPKSNQERIIGEIVSYLGTGEFFSIPPIKVLDDSLGSGGSQHKWATVKTKYGVLSVSEVENKIHLHGEGLKDITLKGMRTFFENKLKNFLSTQLYNKFKITFGLENNPANPNGIGYISVYDTRFERIIITKRDYQLTPEKYAAITLIQTVSQLSASGGLVYCLQNSNFYDGINKIEFTNRDYFEDKSWTLSYSLLREEWRSFHSYIPYYYIHNQSSFYASKGDEKIWKFNMIGKYQRFFDTLYPFIVEFVKLSNPIINNITEDLMIQTEAKSLDNTTGEFKLEDKITYNKLLCYNTNQSTGEVELKVKEDITTPSTWLQDQVKNNSTFVSISRKEKDWSINNLRDNVINYNASLFKTDWNSLKQFYYIDKVVNSSTIDQNKAWHERQLFRDKFLIIRLKFDNFDNVKLTHNFTIESEQISPR